MGLISKIEEAIHSSSSKKEDTFSASLTSQPTHEATTPASYPTSSANVGQPGQSGIHSTTNTGLGQSTEHYPTDTSSALHTSGLQPSHSSTVPSSDAGLSGTTAEKPHVHFGQSNTNNAQSAGVSGIGSDSSYLRSDAPPSVTGSTAGTGNTLTDGQTSQVGHSDYQRENQPFTIGNPSTSRDQQYGATSSREQQIAAATVGSSASATRSHNTPHETEMTPAEDPSINLTRDGGIEKKHGHSHSHSGTQDVHGFYPNLENPDAIPEAGGLKVGSHVHGKGRDFESEERVTDGHEHRQHEHHVGRDAALATGAAAVGAHEEGKTHHHDKHHHHEHDSHNTDLHGANKNLSTGTEYDKHHHHDTKHDHHGRDAALATGAAGLGAHELEKSHHHREQDSLVPGQSASRSGETPNGNEHHHNHHNAKHDHEGRDAALATGAAAGFGAHELGKSHHNHEQHSLLPGQSSSQFGVLPIGSEHHHHSNQHHHNHAGGDAAAISGATGLGAHEFGKDRHHEQGSHLPGQSSHLSSADPLAGPGTQRYGEPHGHHSHHVGEDSAVAAGLGSAGITAHELNKHHQHPQTSQLPGQSVLRAPQPGTTLLGHGASSGLDQTSGFHQHPGQAADLTDPANVSYMNRSSADPYAERFGSNATGVEHGVTDRSIPGAFPRQHHHHHGFDGTGLTDTKGHERRFDSGNHSDLKSASLLSGSHDHSTQIPSKHLAAEQKVGGADEASYRQTLDRVRADFQDNL